MTAMTSTATRPDTTTAKPHSQATDRLRIDPTERRIRAQFDGHTVADSTAARLAFVDGRHPEYLVPTADVVWELLDTDDDLHAEPLGEFQHVIAPNGDIVGKAFVGGAAADHVLLRFDAMSAWLEEAEHLIGRPRDPFRRVDVIESDRTVEVSVNGRVLARSTRPRLVTETGLPPRWYLPRADVEWTALSASDTTSSCQYKGIAEWWHGVIDGDDIVDIAWGYERPIAEAPKLAGLVAFYAEHPAVEVRIDGEVQVVPRVDASWINPSLHLDS